MIFTYSVLKGSYTLLLGSFAVHLALLISMWVCIEPIAASEDEYIEGLVRPKYVMLGMSAIHIMVTVV